MVLEVGSDSAEVLDDGDVEPLEQIARPNAAELEDLGCMNPARRQDDLTFGRDGRLSGRVVSAEHVDPLSSRLGDPDLCNIAIHQALQVGAMPDGIVVRLARRAPCQVCVGTDRLPGNTEKVTVHAPIVTEQVTQIVRPGFVDMVCAIVSGGKRSCQHARIDSQTSGHCQGGNAPCAGP